MALKHKIEKLEDVPETVRSFYEPGTGGFFLQVEGMVPKAQLDEFRTNNIELRNKVTEHETKFAGIDPVKYKEYEATALKTPEAIETAVRARVAQLQEETTTQITERDTKIATLSGQLNTVLVDGTLRQEAAKAGVLATALEDVVLRGRTVFHTVDGKLVAKDDKGNPLYDKDGTSPLAVGSWLKDLKKNAPHLYEGMRGGGGQGNNGGAGSAGGFDMTKATAAQKIAHGLAIERGGSA